MYDKTPYCAIFCGPSTLDIVALALKVYKYAQVNIEIQLVIPKEYSYYAEKMADEFGVSVYFDENIQDFEIVNTFLQHHRDELLGRSWKWYKQQYLKLGLAWKSDRMVFIHDGDTIFSPSIFERLIQEPFLLTTRERVDIYLAGLKLLGIPLGYKSYIANGGIFYPSILLNISSDPSSWFIDAIKKCVLSSNVDQVDFSEYQIMGSLLQDSIPSRQLKLFRRFDLLAGENISKINYLNIIKSLKKYDAIALEMYHHRNLSKRIVARLLYSLGFSW
jgi:hypothetical protein